MPFILNQSRKKVAQEGRILFLDEMTNNVAGQSIVGKTPDVSGLAYALQYGNNAKFEQGADGFRSKSGVIGTDWGVYQILPEVGSEWETGYRGINADLIYREENTSFVDIEDRASQTGDTFSSAMVYVASPAGNTLLLATRDSSLTSTELFSMPVSINTPIQVRLETEIVGNQLRVGLKVDGVIKYGPTLVDIDSQMLTHERTCFRLRAINQDTANSTEIASPLKVDTFREIL